MQLKPLDYSAEIWAFPGMHGYCYLEALLSNPIPVWSSVWNVFATGQRYTAACYQPAVASCCPWQILDVYFMLLWYTICCVLLVIHLSFVSRKLLPLFDLLIVLAAFVSMTNLHSTLCLACTWPADTVVHMQSFSPPPTFASSYCSQLTVCLMQHVLPIAISSVLCWSA
jgi:hypothetical protein